jgi:hypothetical protein
MVALRSGEGGWSLFSIVALVPSVQAVTDRRVDVPPTGENRFLTFLSTAKLKVKSKRLPFRRSIVAE